MLLLPIALRAQPGKRTHRIIVLYWDNKEYPGNVKFDENFKEVLQSQFTGDWEYYPEYFETTRFPGQDQTFFRDYLRQKYAGRTIEVVVATADAPLNFLLRYRADLFPNTPIVFLANQPPGPEKLAEGPGLTGVIHQSTYRETLDLALKLHPDTRHVFVISGSPERDKRFETTARKELGGFENRVELVYLTDLPLNELVSRMASLPPKSIAFYVWQQSFDERGKLLETYEVLARIAPSASAPIYGMGSGNLGLGIVGGYLHGPDTNGRKTAEMTLRILKGERAGEIGLEGAPAILKFDWRQLERWGISEKSLPSGSVVAFRQVTFWEHYKWYILVIITVFFIETSLIAWLLLVRARRRQAEIENERLARLAKAEHTRLDEIVSNVPGIVWETRADPGTGQRKTTFISDYVQRMLGYTPEEWLAAPPGLGLRIMPEEEREKVARESDAVMTSGNEGISEFRWQTKDGRLRWVENYLSPIIDETQGTVGLRGVAIDITDRKKAEAALRESESRLRLAQQAARVGTWEWHLPTGASVWSEMIWELLGLEPGDGPQTAQRFAEFIHPEDRERAWRKVHETIANGGEYYDEFRIVRADGQVLWLSSKGRVFRSADGTPERMIGVNIDIDKRKLAEETARQTQQKERAILKAIPDLMFLQTQEGVYLDYHAKDPRDLFVAPERFIGKNMRDILPAELADRFARCFERADEMGEPQILEYKLTINETDRWYEARIVRSGENILTVVRDITQRVFIEEAVNRSEAQLAGIIGSAMDAIITVDENQRVMLFNTAAEKIFRCPMTDAIGQSFDRFIAEQFHETYHEDLRKFRTRGANGKGVRSSELYGLRQSGEEFPMEATISQVTLNGQQFSTIILRDITDRKRAMDDLRQSEERFSKAFRANPQPMSLTTMAEGRYLDVNDSFLAVSGYQRDEVIGHTSLELAIWETPESRADFIQELEDRGSVVNLETQFRTKNGGMRTLLSSAERLNIGGQDCLLVASSDITDRIQAQQELRQAHEELMIAHEEVNRLKNQLEAENIYLQQELQQGQTFGEMVGQSDALKYVLFKVSQVAVTDSTVLITGETGTGKELVARAIHSASLRKDRPLIKVNCAALPASLIESELFGHEKGAFTSAVTRKLGRFELANGGTIFLDEIGDLPLESQVKLLRVLQEGEIERVGGTKTIKIDVRIIAATNRNLKEQIEKSTFREDLWYRLNVFPITVPPLRQRKEDIALLVEYFANKAARKFGKQIESVSANSMRKLEEHSWPGNVRELANVIERAVIHCQGNVLHLVDAFDKPAAETGAALKSLEAVEREYIIRILESTGWRIEGPNGAAKTLGLNPSTLRTRMAKLGINKRSLTAAN